MSNLKVAVWNIFFSGDLVDDSSGTLQVNPAEQNRAQTVANVITAMDADIFGIVECMPLKKLRFFRDNFLPGYDILIEGNSRTLNLALLYRPDKVNATLLPFPRGRWEAKIGYEAPLQRYGFSRIPLVAGIQDLATGERFAISVVHMKSKKTYSDDEKEPLNNRKKIVAQGRRTREIMAMLEAEHSDYKRFIVMGDVNDGPGFDEYEAKIVVSGIETLLGSVFAPNDVYRSFNDLSGGGQPTTPFSGAPQLDHILFSQSMERPRGARIVEGSGRIRNDLVDFSSGSGKTKDSDHAPIQIDVST